MLTKRQKSEGVDILDPREVSQRIIDKLLVGEECVSMREFIKNDETQGLWDVYADLGFKDLEPGFYKGLM